MVNPLREIITKGEIIGDKYLIETESKTTQIEKKIIIQIIKIETIHFLKNTSN